MWDIVYSSDFEQWVFKLDDDSAKGIFRSIGILKGIGPTLGRPHVDSIHGSALSNLKELRTQVKRHVYRTFFVFDSSRKAIILIGGDKVGDKRFYQRMIPLAEEIYNDYKRSAHHGKKNIS
jgi:hypothetical protein